MSQPVGVWVADFPAFGRGLSLRPELGIDWSRSQARISPPSDDDAAVGTDIA